MVIIQFTLLPPLMSLVVDLALQIVCPKLSAHATPPPRLRGTSRPSPLPFWSSRLRREPWFSCCLCFRPWPCRSPCAIAAVHHLASIMPCDIGYCISRQQHPPATSPPREHAACVALTSALFLFSWPPLTGVARRAQLHRLCTRGREMGGCA